MGEQMTFLEEFGQICARYGAQIALRAKEEDGYREFSYGELWEKSRSFSVFLRNQGLRLEECVSVLCANRPEWAMCFFGIIAAGGSMVPLDEKLKERELAYILNNCRSRILIVDANNLPRARALRWQCALIRLIICFDPAGLRDAAEEIYFMPLTAEQNLLPAPEEKITDGHVGLIVYTSGTMGYQKGVQLMLSNLSFQLHALDAALRFPDKERFLSILPLSHILEITGGLLVPLFKGFTVTYFNCLKPADLIQEIKDSKITMLVVVPLILRLFHNGILRAVEKKPRPERPAFHALLRFCRRAGAAGVYIGNIVFRRVKKELGASLRCFICGGAPLDPELAHDFELFGIPVLEGYGLSETSPVISVNRFGRKKTASVGIPLDGIEVRIAADKPGEREGEIITRGPHVMKGYLNDPDKTREMIREGWLYTGDAGYIDAGGYLHVSGRLKNVVVTGEGKKIFPEELEQEFLKSPYIKDACVFGEIIKEGWKKGSEQIKAVIVPDLDYFLTHAKKTDRGEIEQMIKKEIRQISRNFADYKRISDVRLWYEEFPKTTTRKIKRKEVIDFLNQDKT